jgi:hypothetical protein
VIPAISNAIYDAVGVRLTELPFHPGKILRLLRQQGEQRAPKHHRKIEQPAAPQP